MPSTLWALVKKHDFNPSTASPRSRSISALMMKRPSESLGPPFRGVSPHRTVISVGVFSTTSKWSVILTEGSYRDLASWSTVHSWSDVAGPSYFRER